jgi:hypothetical protein
MVRRGASKYLYLSELRTALDDQRTVCVYQHFPRVNRAEYVAELRTRAEMLRRGTGTFVVYSSTVAFVVAGPKGPLGELRHAAKDVVARLPEILKLA